MPRQIDLKTDNFWVKVMEMLVHNWAVVRLTRSGVPELVFFDDRSRVFDTMQFADVDEAIAGLRRNGFVPFDQTGDFKEFLPKPKPPFTMERSNFRPVYSSGE